MYWTEKIYLMWRVVEALVYRETKTRFGQNKLGYLWLIGEPLIQIGVFYILLTVTMRSLLPGVDYLMFVTIGVLGWNLFQDTLVQSMSAVSSNSGLLVYGRIHPIDTVIARSLLEGIVFVMILPLSMVFLHYFGHPVLGIKMGYVLLGALCLWVLSAGVGMLFAVLSTLRPEMKWLVNVLMRPLYLMSGIMFSINMIPSAYQKYLLWNPLVHAFGLLREGLMPSYSAPYVSITYLLIFTILSLGVGFFGFVSQEHRLRME